MILYGMSGPCQDLRPTERLITIGEVRQNKGPRGGMEEVL